jgi:hypothetical protein
MRQTLRFGLLGLTLGLSACAGAGESPTMADSFSDFLLMLDQRTPPSSDTPW